MAARKKDTNNTTKEEINTKENTKAIKNIDTQEYLEVVDVIDTKQEKLKNAVKKSKNNSAYQFILHFIKRLKEDKLYLFSFIITVVFLAFFSLKALEDTEGYYDRKSKEQENNKVTVPTDPTITNPGAEEPAKSDDVDISNYIGIYSREITLTEPLTIDSTCKIDSYKYVYRIQSNKTITKYLTNSCLGTIKIWSGTLTYVSSGGARYISANNINFLFSASSMKEVDADTYKLDEDIDTIRENNKKPNINTYFYNNNIILKTTKDLIHIKGNSTNYVLSEKYNTNTPLLEETVFKATNDNVFRFIAYDSETEEKKCYKEGEVTEEKSLYKTYSIKFNEETSSFNKEKEIVSRNNTVSCETLNEDITSLSE